MATSGAERAALMWMRSRGTPRPTEARQHLSCTLDFLRRDELRIRVGERHVARPKANRGNASRVQERGVRPGAHARDGNGQLLGSHCGFQLLHDRGVHADVAWLLLQSYFNVGVKRGMPGLDPDARS